MIVLAEGSKGHYHGSSEIARELIMAVRTAWMIAIVFAVIGIVIAATFTTQVFSGFTIKFTPRDEDGTALAVDFVRDLAAGSIDSAWSRTSLTFQEEYGYDALANQARLCFSGYHKVIIEAGDKPKSIVGRIEHEGQPPVSFSVEVDDSEDGLMRIHKVSFNR